MELYHKIYKMNPDLTVYLDNPDQLVEHCDELLSHLTGARSMDRLHEEKIAVLRDFYSVCSFDIQDADFPELIGHFDSENEKTALIRKKILLQDTVQYLGSIYKKYHILIYNNNGTLPTIQLDNCMIDYNEIIYVFLTIFLYLPKCPQSLILSALRAFCFCGKPHISRSIFLYFRYQAWLKSW